MAKNITQKQKDRIVELYEDGNSIRDIGRITGHSNTTIGRYTKGIRTLSEAVFLARGQGKCELTEDGRKLLSESGKRSCKRCGKVWTKPEKEFRDILVEMGLGVKFPDYAKEVFGVQDDANTQIYFQYPIQRYLCDFVDVENRIVFMVNGDFWHANPVLYDEKELTTIQKYNQVRDRNKTRYLKSKGWECIVIWESEIKWNKDSVKRKIREARKLGNPTVLHTDDAEFDSQVSHQLWNEKVRELWFKKRKIRIQQKKEKMICEECGEEVDRKRKKQKYCSQKCSQNAAIKRSNKPSRVDLAEKMKNKSYVKIGIEYGVSDNTIRKWAKQYNLI